MSGISYKVNDSFDEEVKENKIFEPAGTNIEKGKNFVFNNCGFFGFFDKMEKKTYEITFNKPQKMYGLTVLNQTHLSDNQQSFSAKDYHQLVDCPILFAEPDTMSFRVNNARVAIGVYTESGKKMSQAIYSELKESMEAVAKFLPTLPVDRYAFLFYIADFRKEGELMKGTMTPGKIIQLVQAFKGQGFGALEHGNSSFYFLPEADVPGLNAIDMIKDVAIHEFMHIITPLGLHSQYIGDFNYVHPVMSQHLWLYEGITEYFAGLIQLQGGVTDLNSYMNSTLASKIKAGEGFPISKMSITEMSKNVLVKPYSKEYNHVYDRGAVLGMLLDLEIIRLTEGKKTLKEVVLTLRSRYGTDKSFDENALIPEFVKEVHPDLQAFFDTYITGETQWNVAKGLANIGIDYERNKTISVPKDPFADNDVKLTRSIIQTVKTVKSVGKEEWAGIQINDDFVPKSYSHAFKNADGTYKNLKEGDKVDFEIERDNKNTTISIPVKYVEKKIPYYFMPQKDASPTALSLRKVWLGK